MCFKTGQIYLLLTFAKKCLDKWVYLALSIKIFKFTKKMLSFNNDFKKIKIILFLLVAGIFSFSVYFTLTKYQIKKDKWMYTLSRAYKNVLGITLGPNVPTTNVGKYIYIDWDRKITPSVKPVSTELKPQSRQPKVINHLLPLSNSEVRSGTDVTHLVIHFSSNVIAKPNDPFIPKDIINILKRYGVAYHYLIARDGTIFRLVDESRNAFHAGRGSIAGYPQHTNRLNHHSIGIGLLAIGTEEEMKQYISSKVYRSIPQHNIGYTDEQYAALNFLLPGIYKRHGIRADRRYVIGHDEYAIGRKRDPGSLFDWSRIGLNNKIYKIPLHRSGSVC